MFRRLFACGAVLLLAACADQPTSPSDADAFDPGPRSMLVTVGSGVGVDNFDLADGSGCAAVDFGWNNTPEGLAYSFDWRGAFQTALSRSAPCAYTGYSVRVYPQDGEHYFRSIAMHPQAGWDPASPYPGLFIIYDHAMHLRFEQFTIPGEGWTEVTFPSGPDIYIVDIAGGLAFYDDLTWTAPITDPTDKDQCKNGGWEAFGFRNQGQCVRFVQTGKDSR